MASQPVNFSSGLPETVLPDTSAEIAAALHSALAGDEPQQNIESIVAADPTALAAWAALGDASSTPVQRYAAYRVGYHRGLDALRAAGWRGSGFVRSGKGGNDAFLRCLAGLGEVAAEIGETSEAERVQTFLVQLDPGWHDSADGDVDRA